MPTYLYECQQCEQKFEIKHSIKEKVGRCEICQQDTLKRVPILGLKLNSLRDKGHRINEFLEREIQMDIETAEQVKDDLKNRFYGD